MTHLCSYYEISDFLFGLTSDGDAGASRRIGDFGMGDVDGVQFAIGLFDNQQVMVVSVCGVAVDLIVVVNRSARFGQLAEIVVQVNVSDDVGKVFVAVFNQIKGAAFSRKDVGEGALVVGFFPNQTISGKILHIVTSLNPVDVFNSQLNGRLVEAEVDSGGVGLPSTSATVAVKMTLPTSSLALKFQGS